MCSNTSHAAGQLCARTHHMRLASYVLEHPSLPEGSLPGRNNTEPTPTPGLTGPEEAGALSFEFRVQECINLYLHFPIRLRGVVRRQTLQYSVLSTYNLHFVRNYEVVVDCKILFNVNLSLRSSIMWRRDVRLVVPDVSGDRTAFNFGAKQSKKNSVIFSKRR